MCSKSCEEIIFYSFVFSEVLCYDRHSKRSKNVFLLLKTTELVIIPKGTPLWTFTDTKLTRFNFAKSLFIGVFRNLPVV